MIRRSRVLTIIVAGALFGACGVASQKHPIQLGTDDVEVASPRTTTTLAPGTPTRHVDICLIRGEQLTARVTELRTPLSVRDTLRALLDAGRTALPAGTRSAINRPDIFTANKPSRGIANVDLGAGFVDIPPATQILAIAQIVCTLTSLPGIGQVHFTHNGHAIDVPRADSSLTDRPVSRDDYRALLPRPG